LTSRNAGRSLSRWVNASPRFHRRVTRTCQSSLNSSPLWSRTSSPWCSNRPSWRQNDVGDTVHGDSEHEQDDSDPSQLRAQLGVGHKTVLPPPVLGETLSSTPDENRQPSPSPLPRGRLRGVNRYSAKITGSLYVNAILRQPIRAAASATCSGDAQSLTPLIARAFEMSQFCQNRQPRLQPAVPKRQHARAGIKVVQRLLFDRVDAKT
jgi:hypothetical protein